LTLPDVSPTFTMGPKKGNPFTSFDHHFDDPRNVNVNTYLSLATDENVMK
jgi:hypothetical protein